MSNQSQRKTQQRKTKIKIFIEAVCIGIFFIALLIGFFHHKKVALAPETQTIFFMQDNAAQTT